MKKLAAPFPQPLIEAFMAGVAAALKKQREAAQKNTPPEGAQTTPARS
jgi:hypothetical protein